MRCELFTDPMYHAEGEAEFNPADVVSVEETTVKLLMRDESPVTRITLKSGVVHVLQGHVAAQIAAAPAESLTSEKKAPPKPRLNVNRPKNLFG